MCAGLVAYLPKGCAGGCVWVILPLVFAAEGEWSKEQVVVFNNKRDQQLL